MCFFTRLGLSLADNSFINPITNKVQITTCNGGNLKQIKMKHKLTFKITEAGYTHQDVADRLGISLISVRRKCAGTRPWKYLEKAELARMLTGKNKKL